MRTESRAGRTFAAVLVASATLLAVEDARADGEREQCAGAADQAQQLRDDGKYRRAREQLLICARDVCPGPIKRDCLDWLRQLDELAPTVVFAAKEGTRDLTDVKVTMDGAPIADHLDGKPVPVDLGKHVFRFEHGGATQDAEVVVGAGQKGRNIAVTFGAAPTPPGPTPTTPRPAADSGGGGSLVVPILLGGVGVVALGSFAVFGLQGKSEVDDLQKCKPRCAQSDVDSTRRKLIIADVSLGVGVVAIGVATVLILLRPKVDADVKTGATSAVRFDVSPLAGGGAAALGGTF